MKVKAEKYGTAVPFVCLNKYSLDNARGIALSGPEAGWHYERMRDLEVKRFSSFRDKEGNCNLAGGERRHSARYV